jgi:DnaJ family protein B protein 13
LKQGVPDGKGGRRGGIYAFDVAPVAIFESFFGTANPYSALMDITNAFEALTTVGAVQVESSQPEA